MEIKRLSELIPPRTAFNYMLKKPITAADPISFFKRAEYLLGDCMGQWGWKHYATILRKWSVSDFEYCYIAFLNIPTSPLKEYKPTLDERDNVFVGDSVFVTFAGGAGYYLKEADYATLAEEIQEQEENEKTIEEIKWRLSIPWF